MDQKKAVARIEKKVAKWLAEWVAGPTQRRICFDGPAKVYGAYLSGEDDEALLSNRTGKLHTWHLVQYEHAALNQLRYSWEDLALAARYGRVSAHFESAFAEAGKRGSLLENIGVLYLSLNVMAGWQLESKQLGDLLLRGLDTSLLDLRHNDRHEAGKTYRHFWFLLHLYADWRGRAIDTALYSYPPDMSPYAAVLKDWRTDDLAMVQGFVCDMADYHLQEARVTAHDEIAEFDTETEMIFPYEILAYLRLREWVGLKNPPEFQHPLMNQPLAKLPEPVPLPIPATPLLDRVIEKFKAVYPGSFA